MYVYMHEYSLSFGSCSGEDYYGSLYLYDLATSQTMIGNLGALAVDFEQFSVYYGSNDLDVYEWVELAADYLFMYYEYGW